MIDAQLPATQVAASPPDKAVVRRLLQGLEAAAVHWRIPGMLAG